jgi:ATP-binding cassette subfamily B protein
VEQAARHAEIILWRRIGSMVRSCWPHLTGITLLNLVATPIALLSPLPLKIAIDSVLGSHALPDWIARLLPASAQMGRNSGLAVAAGLLIMVAVLGSAQSLAVWLLQTYTGERLVHDLRGRLLWHAQRLSLSFHDRRGPTDTAYRIQYDAPAIQNLVIQGIVPLVTSGFAFVSMLLVTLSISRPLALISLCLSPVLFLLARNSSRKVRTGYDGVRELDSSAMLALTEALTSLRAVKAYGQEAYQDELFQRRSRMRMKEQLKLSSVQAGFHVLIGLCIAFATAIALTMGVSQVQAGIITAGDLLLVMSYMAQLYDPLRTVSTKIPELQASMASMQRALSILDETPEIEDVQGAISVQRVAGAVQFSDVNFQYSAGGQAVLQDVSFEIAAGAHVGIIGPSGSGKSTLVNLLTRFYDPNSGRVLLDGVDLRQYKLADLRRQFSIVLQDPMLFSTTVAANIAYGTPDVSRDEVIRAAKLANAHDFISRLPKGYDTPIGEQGTRLSGGERQRIAIARAFLKDSPIVILDEPTSAVDVRTESEILRGLENLAAGRTTFMIAHRLSTLEKCDVVLLLNEGRLTAVGSDALRSRQPFGEPLRFVTPPATLGPVLLK